MIGFKKLELRVLDGATPELEKNLFEIEGEDGKGATQTAKITGLANDPTKTYGSDKAYRVTSRGVGDVKAEVTVVDLPLKVKNAILGYVTKNNVTRVGSETSAPNCSMLLHTSLPDGTPFYIGFYIGKISMDSLDLETIKEKAEELPGENFTFNASSVKFTGDDEDYYVGFASGKDGAGLTQLKRELKMVASA